MFKVFRCCSGHQEVPNTDINIANNKESNDLVEIETPKNDKKSSKKIVSVQSKGSEMQQDGKKTKSNSDENSRENNSNANGTSTLSKNSGVEKEKGLGVNLLKKKEQHFTFGNNNPEGEEPGNKLMLSGEIFFNKNLIVGSHGLKEGLRKKFDDSTFFGIKNSKDYTGNYVNDFVLNFQPKSEENYNAETTTSPGRVFLIRYQKKAKEYVLEFIHNTLILYYKISNRVYFEEDRDYYLILANVFLTINVKKQNQYDKILTITVEIDNDRPIVKYFKQDECPITIGRVNSKININRTSISKRHSQIGYLQSNKQFYYNDLNSTNGSTLLIRDDDKIKLKGEMHFKLEDIPFKIQEIP